MKSISRPLLFFFAIISLILPLSLGTYAHADTVATTTIAVATATTTPVSFKTILSLGMTSPEVKLLQKFLNKAGFPISSTGGGFTWK